MAEEANRARARLLVITPRELTHDVRARRQVLAAQANDIDVAGLSMHLEGEQAAALPGVEIARAPGGALSVALRKRGLGGWRRSGPLMREVRGLYRLARFAKTTLTLVRSAPAGPFDVVHANDLDSLAAGWLIARKRHARLVYDAHELYSELETDPPRVYRAVMVVVERFLARRAAVVMTNCPLFADFLEQRLKLARRPAIVLNCPDLVPAPVPSTHEGPLRAVYQAAMDHEGRPVTDLVTAAEHAPDVHITVRVVTLDREAVQREIARRGVGDRIAIEPPVDVADLVSALAGFDVGLVINRPATLNDELSLPGKIFEYMMGGLAVGTPRLAGVVPLVEDEGVGVTYEPGNAASLGAVLQELARDPARLQKLREQGRDLAEQRYNAGRQADALVSAWLPESGGRAAPRAARS